MDKMRRRRRLLWSGGIALVAALALSACGAESGADTAPAVGPMGGPVVQSDGQTATGIAAAGGVEVEGAEIDLGRVPLDVTVIPTWTIRNVSTQQVTLTGANIEVVEGCCPGQLSVDRKVLEPNESAELTFPLQMHAGMDGPHRFLVKVFVGPQQEELLLGVTGDFRN